MLELDEINALRGLKEKVLDVYHIERENDRRLIAEGILHEINHDQEINLITDEARETLSWALHNAVFG